MKLPDEIGDLAADLKGNQEKLLSHARSLESIISDRTAELALGNERITQLNAANDELTN